MAYWFRMSLTCSSCSVIGTRECILSIQRADNYNHNSMETSLINTIKVLSCAFTQNKLESYHSALLPQYVEVRRCQSRLVSNVQNSPSLLFPTRWPTLR